MTARALYDFKPSAEVELELEVSFLQCSLAAVTAFYLRLCAPRALRENAAEFR